jgi:transcriptional regulator with XRE-family HTH domain
VIDGKKLVSLRKSLNFSQGELGDVLGVKQKQVSLWEGESTGIPSYVNVWANAVLAEKLVAVLSKKYSHTPLAFKNLRERSPKFIERLSLHAVIKESETEGFADATMHVTIEGGVLPRNDVLYLDCYGISPKVHQEGGQNISSIIEGSELLALAPEEFPGFKFLNDNLLAYKSDRAIVEMDQQVLKNVGRHAIGYEIKQLDTSDKVEVVFRMARAIRTGSGVLDAAGLPIYSDVLVERLSIAVSFVGLSPKHMKSELWLVRRSRLDPKPVDLSSDLVLDINNVGEGKHQMATLLFPVSNYVFCLAWGGLIKS